MSQALFSPSDFLITGNPSVSYTGYAISDAPCVTAESSNKPDFSEYLAALDKEAAAADSRYVRDEPPAAAESTSGADEEESVVAAESAAGNIRQAAPFDAGKAGGEEAAPAPSPTESGRGRAMKAADGTMEALPGAAGGESGVAANDVLPEAADEEAAPALAEAAPVTDSKGSAVPRPEGAEKNGAEGEPKSIPLDGHTSPLNSPEGGDGSRPFNVNEGIYVDEKPPEIDQQFAANPDCTAPAETSAGTTKNPAAGKSAEAADSTLESSGVLARAAAPEPAPKATEKSEKKSPSERARRSTTADRTGSGAAVEWQRNGGGDAAQGSGVQEFRRVSAAPEAEITVNLRGGETGGGASGERGALGGFGGAKPAASFESFLARELQQNLNGDIVRQAQVLLREGGEGTIRLSLKPESLGKVKIHLEMAENKITGKIVVESGEALRAFEHEIDSLEQTFRGGGFDGASLSLELAEHDGPQGNMGEWRNGGEKVSTKTASSRYDEAAGKAGYFDSVYSAKQINVLV